MLKLTIQELQHLETEMLEEVDKICRRNNLTYYLAYGTALGAVRHGGPIPWDPDADIIIPYDELNQFIEIVRKELPTKFYLDFYDTNPNYVALFPRIGLNGYSTKRLHLDVFAYCGMPDNKSKHKNYYSKILLYRKMHVYKQRKLSRLKNLRLLGKIKFMAIKALVSVLSIEWIRKKHHHLCSKHPILSSEFVTNISGGYGYKEITPKSWYGRGKNIKYMNNEFVIPEIYESYLENFYKDYMTYPPKNERKIQNEYLVHKRT